MASQVVSFKNVLQMLHLAHKYDVQFVANQCCSYLRNCLSNLPLPSRAPEIYELRGYSCDKTKKIPGVLTVVEVLNFFKALPTEFPDRQDILSKCKSLLQQTGDAQITIGIMCDF